MQLRRLIAALSAVALAAGTPLCASALPGQSIGAFRVWAAGKPQLKGIAFKKNPVTGIPAFSLFIFRPVGALAFVALTDGKRITAEDVGVGTNRGDPGSAPISHDGTGFGYAWFAQMYGPRVAADYRAATLVARLVSPTDRSVWWFYRGRLYGYAREGNFLRIATPPAFDAYLALMRRCLNPPHECRP